MGAAGHRGQTSFGAMHHGHIGQGIGQAKAGPVGDTLHRSACPGCLPTQTPTCMARQPLAKQGAWVEGNDAQRLITLSSSPTQARDNEDDVHREQTNQATHYTLAQSSTLQISHINSMTPLVPANQNHSLINQVTQNQHPPHQHVFPHFHVPRNTITWHSTFTDSHSRCNTFPRHQTDLLFHRAPSGSTLTHHDAPRAICHLSRPPDSQTSTWHCPSQRLSTLPNRNTPQPHNTYQPTPHHHSTHPAAPNYTNHHFHTAFRASFLFPLTIELTKYHTLPTMPITGLICLQTKCMSSGHLTYSSLPPPNTKAINTAHNTYLKMLGLLCSTSVQYILQTSPKIRFSYIDTHGTIQATHSLVPWSDPTGISHLVGAHTNSIQAKTLVSFLSTTFDNFIINIALRNTVALFCTWTDTAHLRKNFVSAMDPASQVGSEPLDHDSSAGTMPQSMLVPLFWLTTLSIPADHPINSPIPKGSFDEAVDLSKTTAELTPSAPTPECHQYPPPTHGATIDDICGLVVAALPPPPIPAPTPHLTAVPTAGASSLPTITPMSSQVNVPSSQLPYPPSHWHFSMTNWLLAKLASNDLLPFVNITCGQFDRTFIRVVTNFEVMHTHLEQNSNILVSSLLIFNFLCVPHSNDGFCHRMNSTHLYEAEALHIDEATHCTRHTVTTLFVDGSQMAYSCKLIAGHNSLLFLCTLSGNAEHNLVYKGLLSLLHLFHSPCVQMWIKQSASLHPYDQHWCLLCEFHTANSAFPSLISLVEQAACCGNHLNPFTSAPNSFLWWSRHKTALQGTVFQKGLNTPSDERDSKRQRHQSTASNPALTPPSDTSTSKPTSTWDSSCDQAHRQGLFILKSGAGCPHLDNHLLGPNKACMCLNHCFIGSFCPRTGAQCKFFHAITWAVRRLSF
eukprot:jgi/Psemu1/1849/gm1.1849_g